MSTPIEDYAIIGDTGTVALVSRDGSIDWLCLPRFDSPACFASLLGDPSNGAFRIGPVAAARVRRRYRDDTLVLETIYESSEGIVRVIDCMPPGTETHDVVRVVEGVSGAVQMHMHLTLRFDYGSVVPWVRRVDDVLTAVAGPDAVSLYTTAPISGEGLATIADFTVVAGERVEFVLNWHPSHLPAPSRIHASDAIAASESWWRTWAAQCTYDGPHRDAVMRSLLTLKALTFSPTGGIVAAPTTSLPEHIGGVRNWDYRYCWLRDATFALYALMTSGFIDEARAWRDWLLRAVAGDPSKLQIMYGAAGERRLTERELPWLPGYENSSPVRIGNAAAEQFQLDVYGEVLDCLHEARRVGIAPGIADWALQRRILRFLETACTEPDEGIWEIRGPRQHFTHSKVMAWVAFDRGIKAVEQFGCGGPVEQWRAQRQALHEEICLRGFNPKLQSFTQAYDGETLDASVLLIPLVGFLPPNDPRVLGTVAAIERSLMREGFVLRYATTETEDGLPPGEGVFLPCSFWLADNYALQGRHDDARALFERLLAIRNDVGLLSEEYDPRAKRLLGNFPQALSHLALINTAHNLASATGPARHRGNA